MKGYEPLKGYEQQYMINREGDIVRIETGRIKKSTINNSGYKTIHLCREGLIRSYLVHRLVALQFIPNPNNYPQVNHLDNNKTNNCVDNLQWCTPEMNMQQEARQGKIYNNKNGKHQGSMTAKAKLTEDEVRLIRMFLRTKNCKQVAAHYGVSHVTIGYIKHRITWKHI